MTKVTMPEPVAWRSKYKSDPGMIGIYPWSYVEHSLRQPALNNYDIESLITTAQAEAYANIRVRDALEEAAEVADRHNAFATYDAIRALIPKEKT